MPTFLSRRYMRKLEEVGRTERVLGVLLLFLLGGIVAALVMKVASDENYLFEVHEAVYRETERAREVVVAEQMLPTLDDPGWRAAGEAEAIPESDLSAALGETASDLEAFDVLWVYRRRYVTIGEPGGELTVLVCDVGSPEQAFGLWQGRQPADSEALNVGRGGWSAKSEGRAGFWKGRYYTELQSSPQRPSAVGKMLLMAANSIAAVQLDYGTSLTTTTPAAAGTVGVTSPADAGRAENLFPEPGVRRWRVPRNVSRYTPDNLYVKINGRAGAYLQFHVVGLTFGTYYHQRDPERTIDVYWYDMGEPENALGIYGSEAAHEATPVPIGRDGYQVGGAVFFWKGASYVQVLPVTLDQADGQVARAIAERLADNIEDSGHSVWALAALPQTGKVPGSFNYQADDVFSLDFLNDVFTMEYDVDGGRITLFIHRAKDESTAGLLFHQYVGFFEKYGRVIWTDPDPGRRIVAGEASGVIDVVFANGRYLGGVAGAEDVGVARNAGAAFYDELSVP
ncbi:MAG: DUF6599 family protein [Phycisphaerae bacterium]